MKKFTIRLLTLAMFATPLAAIQIVSPADAATNDKTHVKKHAKKMQRAPAVQDATKSPFTSSYENDFDRRNAGGGGGY
jgi:Ni/Co efflux regulator RcnB